MQFHDKFHNVFVELVLCRCVSQWQELTRTSKNTQMQNVQVHKYKNTHCICGLGGVPLRLPVTGTHYPAPPTTISNSFPLSLILNAHQATYWPTIQHLPQPSPLLHMPTPLGLRRCLFDLSLICKLAKLGWFKPWEKLFYTFGNFCKFHQGIHIFLIHFWNI